jgi:hypothetical protein
MFGVGVGIRVGGFTPISGGGEFDPDAQAFFDRVTTAGGTLTTTEKNATNQLVLDMKSAGIWSSMKAIYPMVGASAAACAQNLKSSSFTGTFTSGWTFASTGVTGNGTSTYFDTTFNPNVDASLGGFSFGGYLRLNLSSPTQVDGVFDSSFAQHNFIDGNMFSGGIGEIISYTANPSQRMFVHRRTSASFAQSYRDSTSLGTATSTASGLPNANYYIGARNQGGGVQVLYTSQQYAFYFLGLDLSNQNALDLTTAVNTFQTTLSRNV